LASGFELREGFGTILLTIKVYGAAEKRRVNGENTKTESNAKKVMDIVERFYGFLQNFLTVLCVTLINELLCRNVIRLRYMYNCKSPLESLLLYVPNFLKF
jgi:hypothetical protein